MNGSPSIPVLFTRALAGAALLALARATLAELQDGYLAAGLWSVGIESLRGEFFRGLALGGGPTLLVSGALGRLPALRSRASRVAMAAISGGAAFAFVSHRLPHSPVHAAGFSSSSGLAANCGALAVVALVHAPLLWPACVSPRAVALGGAGLVAAMGALYLGPSPQPDPLRPHVILISVDTLRADHLGCYGYPQPTSPEIDRFAAHAVRFRRAFTPQPWTLTAHMTMLTSLHPKVHGVRADRALPDPVPTLAAVLRDRGYTTLGVVDTVPWLKPEFGFGRGFDLYRPVYGGARRKTGQIEELLEDVGDRPFFLFAHFYDVHFDFDRLPYESAADDYQRLAGSYAGDQDWRDPELGSASRFLQRLAEQRQALPPAIANTW